MRAMWSGSITFGLVNIPVKLYAASEDHELDLHFLHKEDLSPIRYAKVCRADGHEIPYQDLVRGYEYAKGDYIVLTDEDFTRANARKTKAIDIIEFVNEKEIDPSYFEKPYYLEPEKGADKAYALLREALKKTGKVGIAKFVLRNKEHLAAVRPKDKLIVVNQMKFKEEIRDPRELDLPGAENLRGKEMEMAIELIDQLADKFKPEEFKDTYTEELKQVIEEKAKGKVPKMKGKAPQPTKVSDLMAILKESVERNKK